ncbi:hypothetical protein SD37_00125 [Amycolatopsis orientalis]|uniref:DUF4241 domain-containing protein n=1 Tax=Amycolatopsis orientalis TaxID=31958 RepID=A0A193BPU2_AMYOR|nr:DUF4241 domain-containing protein [Amycolatopsis orientalis]ANN14215.1 hypothetical protein SD37_00125 [Amycolatopsis orientalis]
MGATAKIAIGLVVAAVVAVCAGIGLWHRDGAVAQVDAPENPVRRDGFDELFRDGRQVRVTAGTRTEAVVEVVGLGDLGLPSGRLTAGDPTYGSSPSLLRPFLVTVPPGAYPVSVAKVRMTTESGEVFRRVAAAKIQLRSEPVVRWELALAEGDAPKPGEVLGYGVDSGTGSFLDATAVPALPRLVGESGEGPLMKLFDGDPVGGAYLLEDGGASVAAFTSGWGDGGYPTWIGYTEKGEVARFVTDFHVVS